VGRVGVFTVKAELEGVTITTPWAMQLAGYLEQQDDWGRAVDRWADEVVGKDDAYVGWHYRTGLHAWMAGQLMVRAVEMAEEAEDGAAGTVTLGRSTHVRADEPGFLDLPWNEAVEFFRAKQVMEPEEFDQVRDRYRAGAFTARALASEGLREQARNQIAWTIEDGATLKDTIKAIRNDSLMLGITPASYDALDTIVRTNVATAYGHGRYSAQNDPLVMRLRPYVQFVTANDTRVRPTHQPLHLKVFESGTELADQYAPPIGYRCRCSVLSLSKRQLDERGLTVERKPVFGARPDKGWDGPPLPLEG
jgi:SPP1 gp7 family putative phage head morphogenesis protein